MAQVPSFFGDTPIAASEDLELEIFLEAAKDLFEHDQSTAIAAFEAICFSAAREWNRPEPSNADAPISIPWWAVQAIAIGYQEYKNAYNAGANPRFGQMFGVEPSGRGRRPKVADVERFLRDIRLTFWIANRVIRGETVTSAIDAVAAEAAMTKDSLIKIWALKGERAKAVLRRTRPQNAQE